MNNDLNNPSTTTINADPNVVDRYRHHAPKQHGHTAKRVCKMCKEAQPVFGGKITGPRYKDGPSKGRFIKGCKTAFVCAHCLKIIEEAA